MPQAVAYGQIAGAPEVDVEFINVHPEAFELLQRAGLSPRASSGPALRT